MKPLNQFLNEYRDYVGERSKERKKELLAAEKTINGNKLLSKKLKEKGYVVRVDGPLFSDKASGADRIAVINKGKDVFRIFPPTVHTKEWSIILMDVQSGYMSYIRQKDTYSEKGLSSVINRLIILLE